MTTTHPPTDGSDVLLLAGLWLPVTVWDAVAEELRHLGHRPQPLALPGTAPGQTTATLEDQLDAVLAAVDAAPHPVVVGHSAACTLAWLAADRRPERVARLVLVGGFPGADGEPYADLFPPVDGVMAFPGWEPFEGPDAADLDAGARAALAAATVPVPATVSQATVRLTDECRFGVPVTMVCPEFSPEEARAWVAAGDLPELARVAQVDYLDVDTGHWPMVSAPAELARALDAAVRGGGA
ncbi:alpha/beta fold hydrolase [Auraticoccus monumenti]|uniref:Pimeloyl-ACP methyl ester carboxylesterase n=1 Tax=Auraticoccus monumenti TaxID=675864 RepID=A0A1G6XP55_9ACTN|nr:alpha/beta hydrolase [Auraticoccus monumenti]SDD79147.1 Pimeloyl-ACP methyl ester carboxylesterase [Auraticoccus monumenti]